MNKSILFYLVLGILFYFCIKVAYNALMGILVFIVLPLVVYFKFIRKRKRV